MVTSPARENISVIRHSETREAPFPWERRLSPVAGGEEGQAWSCRPFPHHESLCVRNWSHPGELSETPKCGTKRKQSLLSKDEDLEG